MQNHQIRKEILRIVTAIIVFSLMTNSVSAYQSGTTYGSQTVSISGSAQNQSTAITLPVGATAYAAQTNNGNVSFSQSGNQVSVNASGGSATTSTSQVWNPYKYSMDVFISSESQSSPYFSGSYYYNDGSYLGTLYSSGSANLISGSAGGSKSATYDYYYNYSATATITSIQYGTIYFNWYYPWVDNYYYYSDYEGYCGSLAFTGSGNATYVDSSFYFPSPNYVGQTGQGYATHIFHYSGTVSKPDTTQWSMNYSGTVYQGGYDTISSTSYGYNVTISYYTTTWINDTTPPSGSATLSPSGITTGDVTITFTATDSGSGVQSITLPNGSVVNGNTATYVVSSNGVYSFIVVDRDGNTIAIPVLVSNIDRTVVITHPISIDYVINPNDPEPFTCPDILITNHSGVKVAVSIQEFTSVAGGTVILNDVLPTRYSDWSTLTTVQTKSDIALGVRVKEAVTGSGSWYSISQTDPVYAADISLKTLLGVLNPSGSGNLSLTACFGTAWDGPYTIKQSLILVFDAC